VNGQTEKVTIELPMTAACALYFRLRHEFECTNFLEWSDDTLMNALEEVVEYEITEDLEP
jgi:hypothetical protein